MSAYADARRTFSEVISIKKTPGDSGANTLIAAVAGRRIRVLSMAMSAAAAVNCKFQSSTTTDITGLIYFTTGELNVVLPHNPFGWFQTVAGELLGCDLSGAQVVTMQFTYVLI